MSAETGRAIFVYKPQHTDVRSGGLARWFSTSTPLLPSLSRAGGGMGFPPLLRQGLALSRNLSLLHPQVANPNQQSSCHHSTWRGRPRQRGCTKASGMNSAASCEQTGKGRDPQAWDARTSMFNGLLQDEPLKFLGWRCSWTGSLLPSLSNVFMTTIVVNAPRADISFWTSRGTVEQSSQGMNPAEPTIRHAISLCLFVPHSAIVATWAPPSVAPQGS